MDYNILPLEPYTGKANKKDAKLRRVKARIQRDKYREMAFSGEIQASSKFETDKDFITMR